MISANKKKLVHLKENCYLDIFSLSEAVDRYFGDYQRYDFFQVLWLENVGGNNTYFLDFEYYNLKDNQVFLIFPGQVDCMDITDKKGYLYAIGKNLFYEINNRLQSAFLNGYYGNVFLTIDNDTSQVLKEITQLLESEIKGQNRFSLLRAYFEAFLVHLNSLFEKTDISQSKVDTRIGELMRLVDTYFLKHRTVEFYAEKLKLSSNNLNKLSLKATGKTVKQHIQECILLEAKKELRLGLKSIKEIAFDLGFNEAAYFSRFFKKYTSYSPAEFRDKR